MAKNNDSQKQESNNSFIILLILLFFFVIHQAQPINASHQVARPLFKVNLLVPTSSPITIRQRVAELLTAYLPRVGIETEVDLISWARFGPRVTDQEVGAYADGGYDITLFPISMETPATHQGSNIEAIFGKNSIPPHGYNVMYWSVDASKGYNDYRANESENLIQKINTNRNLTEATADFIEWQKVWYDTMPICVIHDEYEIHAVSKGLYGYDPARYPLNSLEDIWLTFDYTGTADTVVLAASTGAVTLNSLISNDVYSAYANSPVMDTLYGLTPSEDVYLPSDVNYTQWMLDNYETDENYVQYPRMAAAMGNYTTTGLKKDLEYNVSVRDDVLWHDGHIFDAWDVAFTFQAVLTPQVKAPEFSRLKKAFGEDDKANHHGVYSFIVEDKNNDDHFEHISFQLNAPYGALELQYIGGLPILPEHILGNQINHGYNAKGHYDPIGEWSVPPLDWKLHSYNTGRTSDPGGLTGPIGTGSMVFKSFNPSTSDIILEKFENIQWNQTNRKWVANDSNDHFLVKDGKLNTMPKIAKIKAMSSYEGFISMKNGFINVMDPKFYMRTVYEDIQTETTIQALNTIGTAKQALFFNPRFKQDGIWHLNKKGVRHAISHIIPREEIIEEYLRGLGVPAYTPIPRKSWAAIPEADLLSYKKTLTASDESTPEKNAKSAYDEYNITIALNWLTSEGYNVEPWRNPTSSTTADSSTDISSTTDLFTTVGLATIILFLELFTFFFLFFFLQRLKR
ncbi:MAG: ABC transporter substrate-binding protein [Candidatus Hodarchaeota archaeon]